MAHLLETKNLTMTFGGLTAVSDLNIEIDQGQIIGLIGPNGAGKTTAFNMITGVYKPSSGSILFKGNRIDGMKPHRITAMGIARTFQNIRLFKEMSVLENVLVAHHFRMGTNLVESVLKLPSYQKKERESRELAISLLERLGLADQAHENSTALPYGKQRRLEIARALATGPTMLLLDEPAAGMNPQESRDLMDFIFKIREDFNLTILLIEHHMQVVMGVCERMYVLDYGITIAHGSPEHIRKNPKVIEAYLGADAC